MLVAGGEVVTTAVIAAGKDLVDGIEILIGLRPFQRSRLV